MKDAPILMNGAWFVAMITTSQPAAFNAATCAASSVASAAVD